MTALRQEAAPALVNAGAERVVLGKILADDKLYYEVGDRLTPDDFGTPDHQTIYKAMQSLVAGGRPITRSALCSQLAANDNKESVDTAMYLAGMMAEGEQADNAKPINHFAEIVAHRAGCRKLIDFARYVHDRARAATIDTPVEELRGAALAMLAASESDEPSGAVKFRDLMTRVIQKAANDDNAGIKTGVRPVDDILGPLLPKQLIVIGGETSSGKTALAMEIVYEVGRQGIPTLVFELEMADDEIGSRWLAAMSHISSERISEGGVDAGDLDRLSSMAEDVGDLPIWIDDRPAVSVATLQARLARAIRTDGIMLAVIDHLQYVRPNNDRADERERIRQVVDDIKAMAKRLGIPVILVSHVSRQVNVSEIESADDIKRPELRDLYGSSAIEKAADGVLFVHRPHYFLERATMPGSEKAAARFVGDVVRWQGKAELVLCKRRGRKGFGVSQCEFDEELTWFKEAA